MLPLSGPWQQGFVAGRRVAYEDVQRMIRDGLTPGQIAEEIRRRLLTAETVQTPITGGQGK